ncbi:MAG: hypothetical protein IJD43_07660 [Thermoguttaceae bacterium]|nr:hypothetical protein [Thermoguttaceae bacterium]
MKSVIRSESVSCTSSCCTSFCALEENVLSPRAVSGTSSISLDPVQCTVLSGEMPLNGTDIFSSLPEMKPEMKPEKRGVRSSRKESLRQEEAQAETSPLSLTPKELADLNWGLGVHLDPECQKRYEKIRREKILAQRKSLEDENWEARCFPH